MPRTYCLLDDVAGEGGEYDGTEKRNEQEREGHWIFMDKGSCSHLTYNTIWCFCVIYSSCVVKLSNDSAFKAAALFVVICHPLTSVSIVSSASPPPPVCPSVRPSVFARGNIFRGRYYFHKNNTSWFLSACRTLLWIWERMTCHYNNITSTLAALRRGAS